MRDKFGLAASFSLKTFILRSRPGVAYCVGGICYVIAAILGYCISKFAILNSRDKHTKSCMVLLFILVMLVTIFAMGTLIAYERCPVGLSAAYVRVYTHIPCCFCWYFFLFPLKLPYSSGRYFSQRVTYQIHWTMKREEN